MSHYFKDTTWVELEGYVKKDALIILPVGETEEHSLYLPVDCDARIAEYLADQIADEVESELPVLVMSTIWAGYTPNEICKWPGAMRVRPQIFLEYIHDICASLAEMGFSKLIMLDCHGQHNPMLNIVTKLIADEYQKYYVVASPLALSSKEFNEIRKSERGGVCHACEWETSLIMYISPDAVKTELLTDEDALRHHSDFVSGDSAMGGQKVVWSTWGIQRSKNGAYGDPTSATAETGKAITAAVRKNFASFIREYYNHKTIMP